jgi:hypothetical protein
VVVEDDEGGGRGCSGGSDVVEWKNRVAVSVRCRLVVDDDDVGLSIASSLVRYFFFFTWVGVFHLNLAGRDRRVSR